MNRNLKSKIIFASMLLCALLFMLTDISAQTVISQWNGYTSVPEDGKFLATAGIALNKGTAVLTREATTSGIKYVVNTDGVAASQNWDNADRNEKYWIATFSTAGYETLILTSKQQGSSTGPKYFKIQYETSSGVWNDLPETETITILTSSKVEQFDLPEIMEDRSSVSLRWLCTSTTSIGSDENVKPAGVNRLDVVVSGTAKSGVVDPKITVNATTLRFTTQNNTKTLSVKGSNLGGQIKITSDNPNFYVTPSTLPAAGGGATVRFTGTVAHEGKITLQSGNAKEVVNLIAMLSETGNDGTKEHPFTVAEGMTYQNSIDSLWVKGYIVGAVKAGKTTVASADDVLIGGTVFDSPTNVLIAADANETDYKNCMAVELLSSSLPLRTEVNLVNHSENMGVLLNVKGKLHSYFSLPGSRGNNGKDYVLGNTTGLKPASKPEINVYAANGTIFVKNLTETAKISVYDLTGRLVTQTTATTIPLTKVGIYVVKVGDKAFKVIN